MNLQLALVLSKIIEKDKIVKFKVIGGDITTKYGTNSSNILNEITKKIKEFIEKYKYLKNDILKVIHLIDTDGTYIDNGSILHKDVDKFEYGTQFIYAKNVEDAKKRNEQKSQVLNKLIGTKKVYTALPYEIYFFSSNLEHVLHNNNKNLSVREKIEYAYIFEDKFADNPFQFIEFMNSTDFALVGSYNQTWEFIKIGINSLNRYTNFNVFLNNL